ncbi:hypothetical protein [Xanthobacter sp. KR7-225]|uniref:hypothetical protein n=1 Tax=Xanthobacter sp. KR7-225 TaxID=3156613 RepID=UPI0032B49170
MADDGVVRPVFLAREKWSMTMAEVSQQDRSRTGRDCIVFACSGVRYAAEAVDAARQVKAVMPGIDIVGFADAEGCKVYDGSGLFTRSFVIENPARSYIDKARIDLPDTYDRALFLDSDAYVIKPLDSVFELLERFDMVVAHEPTRFTTDAAFRTLLDWGAPRSFPECNTGVIGFRNNAQVRAFFQSWREKHRELHDKTDPPVKVDQPSFRLALWESDLRFYILPPEFNFRHTLPGFIGGYYNVMVLHGRTKFQEHYSRKLGAYGDLPRVHVPFFWVVTGPRRLWRRWRRKHGMNKQWLKRTFGLSH